MSSLHLQTPHKGVKTHPHMSGLIEQVSSHPHTDQSTSMQGVKIKLYSSSLITTVSSPSTYINQTSSGQSSSLLMKASCLRLKLVENFFVSFDTDDQSNLAPDFPFISISGSNIFDRATLRRETWKTQRAALHNTL